MHITEPQRPTHPLQTLLEEHRDALAGTASQLLEREVITGEELAGIVDAHPPSSGRAADEMVRQLTIVLLCDCAVPLTQ